MNGHLKRYGLLHVFSIVLFCRAIPGLDFLNFLMHRRIVRINLHMSRFVPWTQGVGMTDSVRCIYLLKIKIHHFTFVHNRVYLRITKIDVGKYSNVLLLASIGAVVRTRVPMYCCKYPWALLIVLLTTHLNSDFVYRNRLRLVDSKINSFFDHFCGQWWLQLLRVTRQMRLMARTRELIPRIGRAREGCCCCCGSYLIGWSMPFKKIIKFTLTLVLYFGHTTYLPT